MTFLKRYGKQLTIASISLGLLLTVLSMLIPAQPIYAEIWLAGNDEPFRVLAHDEFVANWLQVAGVRLFPHDSIRYSGLQIPHDFVLPDANEPQLVYKPAIPINLTINGESEIIYSGADTLGEAMWEHGIFLKEADSISIPLHTALNNAVQVSIQKGQPVTILLGDEEITIPVAAETVGEALGQAGYPLQNLDYAEPGENEPIPEDRIIRITRVREEVLTEEIAIPFATERVSDPNMNVGEEQVLQSGQNGAQSSTVRVRYENGKEVSRDVISEWVSEAPVSERIAYGGNVVVETYQSSEGAVDYWLEMDVRVTTYRDTGNPTASGIWPYYGTIAVNPEWYSILKGTSIYVPGYGVGTVLDVCPGCVGEPWIDVFIPIDQYVAWSKNLTVYFLPPAPDGFTGELP